MGRLLRGERWGFWCLCWRSGLRSLLGGLCGGTVSVLVTMFEDWCKLDLSGDDHGD
jgi:hypothetical protein